MKGSKKKEKLSMEKYMDFVLSQEPSKVTKLFLNQIISMHGFKKINNSKSVLSDAVGTLNLMDPSRSTLKENISPCASITLDDITTHLNDLAWRECCVTSIDVINNTNTDIDTSQLSEYFAGKCRDSSASTSSNLGSEIGEVATKMVTKRKRSST